MQKKFSMTVGMIAAMGTLIITFSLPRAASALGDNQIVAGAKRIGHVSAGNLEGACNRSGGTYIETPDEYMCATDSSWVYCEKESGDCVGETDNKDGKKKNTQMVTRQKRQLKAKPKMTQPGMRDRRSRPVGTAPAMR